MPNIPTPGPLTARFDLGEFTDALINDLQQLRKGKISIRDAQARAALAKVVLRGIHYHVTAQKFLESSTKLLPAVDANGDPVTPAKAKRRGGRRTTIIDAEEVD